MSVFSNVFYKKPIVRISNHYLTATQETWLADLQLLRNFFYMALSIIFITYTRNCLKDCSVNKPLYYAKLVLKKKQVFSSVENILVLKFDRAILKK